MKKFFTFILALAAGAGTMWAETGTCGKDGDNLTWSYVDGLLVINGTGDMADWETTADIPWYSCRLSIQTVVIASGVTGIGDNAFFDCKNLPSISLSKNITRIGDHAFVGCNSLTAINVAIDNSHYCSIDGVLFDKSQKTLIRYPAGKEDASYIIPNSVDSIAEYAFQNCVNMSSVTILNNLKSIGWNGFDNCSGLTSITSYAVTPPDCGEGNDRFDKVDKDIPVNVPEGSVEEYKEAPGWSDFTNILSVCVASSGTCGKGGNDNLTWEVSCDGVLTISGEGEMANWDKYHHHPWGSFDVKSVVIKEGVTSIGDYAFRDCFQIRFISIPNSVKYVWGYAFLGCNGLESVDLGSSVTNIGSYAFEGCTALTSVVIPKSVTSIGEAPFRGCSSLESIVVEAGCVGYDSRDNCNAIIDKTNSWLGPLLIQGCKNTVVPTGFQLVISNYAFSGTGLTSLELPQGVTSIREYAFQNCSSLTSITIPSGITEIANYTFQDCSSLSSVTILGKLTNIGNYAFSGCTKLADFAIPATVTSIGKYAFYNCSSLTSVTIPDGMYYTDESVFSNCAGLAALTLHKNITSLGANSFYNCKGLQEIHCYAVTPPTCKTDALYGVSSSTKLYVPEESVETYSNTAPWSNFNITAIPLPYGTCGDNITWNVTDSVLTISGTGAMNCSEPWSFYSPSIKSLVIGEGVTDLGNIYFTDCSSLVSIEVAADNPAFCTIDDVLFNKDKTVLIQYPVGNKRAEYVIPATVDSIGAASFEVCENLTSVIIPASVTKIGEIAFYGCTGLQSITCESSTPPVCSKLCYFTDYCFMCFDGVDKESVILYVPKGSVAAYQEAEEWSNFKNIQPNPVIGQGTCGAEGDNLKWKLMSDGVLTISGSGAMADNVSSWVPFRADIKSIVIEDEATSIGKEAFAECTNLIAVTIPGSVTSIGDAAFRNCSSLPSIALPNGITSISSYVFSGCAKLTEFIIHDAVTEIGNYAFAGCSGLTAITIPRFVTQIGEKAFADCTGLTTITSQAVTPPDCGTDCFQNVNKSIPVNVPEESLEDYQQAQGWKDFTNLQGIECTVASGTNGPDKQLTWTLSCGGTLRIEGKGKMSALNEYFSYPWDDYASEIKSVIVGEGVTLVSGEAFSNLENLEKISLPNSLVTIGPGAFHGNDKLTSVLIPKNVLFIYDKAFSDCTGLTTLVFCGLTSIYDNAFYYCQALSSITCFSVEPLYCTGLAYGDATSEESAKDLPVYVPAESVSKYKAHSSWKMYKILPLSERPNTRIIDTGTAGAKITWTLDSNGILTIKGSGVMDKWGKPAAAPDGKRHLPAEDSAPWYPYLSDIQYIVIESGITTIGDYAFNGCTEVRSITCYAATPPTCGAEAFGGRDTSIPLYVPESAEVAYKNADQWLDFLDIEPIAEIPTAINGQMENGKWKMENTKLLRDGQLFILHNGKTYTLQDQEVR